MNNPILLRAVAALLISIAVLLNGKIDAQSIGEAIVAFVAVLTLIQAAIVSHDTTDHA